MLIAFAIETLVPVALFGLFAAAAWWVLEYFTADKARTVERLDELQRSRAAPPQPGSARPRRPTPSAACWKRPPAPAKPLGSPRTSSKPTSSRPSSASAGFRSEAHASVFLGLKFVLLIIGFVLAGGTTLLTMGMTKDALVWTDRRRRLRLLPARTSCCGSSSSSRKQDIFLALPDALDLLVVCVEAGLGLDQAMRKVSEEMKNHVRRHLRGVPLSQLPAADGPAPPRSAARPGRAHRRGRPASRWPPS